MQYRNSTPGHSRLDSSITTTRIPRIIEYDDPYSEVVMISNSMLSLSDPSLLFNDSTGDHNSLVSVLRDDLGPPPSYDSLTLESPPSYYGAIRMKLYDWMMQKQ